MEDSVKRQWEEVFESFKTKTVEEWEQSRSLKPESRFLVRLARNGSFDEFVDAIENGEIPPMELSEEEMNAVKGGGTVPPPENNDGPPMPGGGYNPNDPRKRNRPGNH